MITVFFICFCCVFILFFSYFIFMFLIPKSFSTCCQQNEIYKDIYLFIYLWILPLLVLWTHAPATVNSKKRNHSQGTGSGQYTVRYIQLGDTTACVYLTVMISIMKCYHAYRDSIPPPPPFTMKKINMYTTTCIACWTLFYICDLTMF